MSEVMHGAVFDDANTVLLRFYRAMDRKDPDSAAACFADDALWIRRGVHLKGRADIRSAIAARPAAAETAHLVNNFLIDANEADECICSYYLTAYLMTDTNVGPPGKPQLPFQLAFMKAHMRLSADRLVISQMATIEQKFIR